MKDVRETRSASDTMATTRIAAASPGSMESVTALSTFRTSLAGFEGFAGFYWGTYPVLQHRGLNIVCSDARIDALKDSEKRRKE